MSRSMLPALAFSALALLGFSAQAQQSFATPQEAIKFRQATLKEMQQNFKQVADMASGRADFDAKVAEAASGRAAQTSRRRVSKVVTATSGRAALPSAAMRRGASAALTLAIASVAS